MKEENAICLTCQWGLSGNCENSASMDTFNASIFDIDLESCEYKFSIYYAENFRQTEEQEENLFDELY